MTTINNDIIKILAFVIDNINITTYDNIEPTIKTIFGINTLDDFTFFKSLIECKIINIRDFESIGVNNKCPSMSNIYEIWKKKKRSSSSNNALEWRKFTDILVLMNNK